MHDGRETLAAIWENRFFAVNELRGSARKTSPAPPATADFAAARMAHRLQPTPLELKCTVTRMTHNQTLAALDRFEATLGQLSRNFPQELDFWPAFATHANELEATSPLDFRDYVRDSIVRMLRKIGRLPAAN